MGPMSKHPLTAYREKRKVRIGELAADLGVNRVTLWRWEKGRLPERDMWTKIEEETGVTPEMLVRYVPPEAAA